MSSFGAGLAQLGLRRGDKVSLFSENSARWLIADQGVMMNGAADAVSGAWPPAEEAPCVLNHPCCPTPCRTTHPAARYVFPGASQRRFDTHSFSVGIPKLARRHSSCCDVAVALPSVRHDMAGQPRMQVRGSTTPLPEQAYILRQSHSAGLIAQDAASLAKLLPHIVPASHLHGANGSNGNGSLNGNGTVRAADTLASASRVSLVSMPNGC